MDSCGDGSEKSLPGIGMPRWMKRTTERYNYADICASPPSNDDGFFHLNRNRYQTATSNTDGQANVECFQNEKKNTIRAEATSDIIPPSAASVEFPTDQPHHLGRGTSIILSKQDCTALKETSNFYKSIATTSTSSLVDLAVASQEGLMSKPKRATGITTNVSLYGAVQPSISEGYEIPERKSVDLDSPISSADVSKVVVTVSKPKGDDTKQSIPPDLATRVSGILSQRPDDTTPSSTPSATPTCSPQVGRRAGNPFFTGSANQEKSTTGNWLFRPASSYSGEKGKEPRNNLYETKVDMRPLSAGAGPGIASSGPKQNVRYVPRPSELRELNFWSPTSM